MTLNKKPLLASAAFPVETPPTPESQKPFVQYASEFSPDDRFIDFSEVQKFIPLSKSRYYALLREKRVPSPVKISEHRACWLLSEVLGYAEARIKERNEKMQQGKNK